MMMKLAGVLVAAVSSSRLAACVGRGLSAAASRSLSLPFVGQHNHAVACSTFDIRQALHPPRYRTTERARRGTRPFETPANEFASNLGPRAPAHLRHARARTPRARNFALDRTMVE
jgi:hypothetical protein